MIEVPSRIAALIARLEAGETITQHEVDHAARLVALDMVKLAEDFAAEMLRTHEVEDAQLAAG